MRRPLTIILLSLTACSASAKDPADGEHPGGNPGQPGKAGNAIDDYINSLPYLGVDPAKIVEGAETPAQRDGDYSCTTQNLQETRQFDRIVAYAANSDSLYPGAIVTADSVVSGLFTPIVLPRAPETISVSLENLGGTKQAAVRSPSLSAYRDALSSIIQAEVTGSTPADLSSEIEQVHTEEQLSMALGVEVAWGLGKAASIKTSFNWSDSTVKSRYLVRFTQAYYTVDLDSPAAPSALLAGDVTLDQVKQRMDETRPPVYVSSVTYGRMVLFSFESQYSSEEMSAALNFAYSGGVDVSGNVSVTYKDMISQSKITAFILGGDAGTAVQTIDSYDALINFIKTGGNYSRESPGAPIAYKLAYLKDNSPARMSVTTDYDVKDCVRVSQKVLVTLKSIVVDDGSDETFSGGDLEIYGTISAAGVGAPVVLFNRNSDHEVTIKEGIANAYGSSTAPLAQAVINVTPQAGQSIQLRAHLLDSDTGPDDDFGDIPLNNLFETGWRKDDVTISLASDDAKVRVVFSLTPI